ESLLRGYRTISLIGLGKNVGKTTVLNCLVGRMGGKLGLTSVGRDGEDVDVVTQTSKPRIFVRAGTIVATAEGLLALCDISMEILAVKDWSTPMGRVVVVRALSAGFVQLGGPSMTAQLAELLKDLESFDIDKILIDGAISRKSLAAPSVADAAILCTGAAISPRMDIVIAKTRHAVSMLTLPKAAEDADCIPMPGAISDSKLKELVTSGTNLKNKTILADDPSKILITPETYEKLLIKQATLAVKTPINLAAVTINPISPSGIAFDPAEFLAKMCGALSIPVFNVQEENNA
ncbi:MAG: hypothetical protein FWC67_04585, partial [Defluviitaleaceae bacterium]|nr:hypothetical protein [Defluviitaleaceae bacterium]